MLVGEHASCFTLFAAVAFQIGPVSLTLCFWFNGKGNHLILPIEAKVQLTCKRNTHKVSSFAAGKKMESTTGTKKPSKECVHLFRGFFSSGEDTCALKTSKEHQTRHYQFYQKVAIGQSRHPRYEAGCH